MFLSNSVTGASASQVYHVYEMNHAIMSPFRYLNDYAKASLDNPLNFFAKTTFGQAMKASTTMFERATRRYERPNFNITKTTRDGVELGVVEEVAFSKPFCNLLHFKRLGAPAGDKKLLICAPMSGHYATLLRQTVKAFLPNFEVYLTDWQNARDVPLSEGSFNLDDYIDYVQEMIRFLGEGVNVVAICQPAVPVLCAIALMEQNKEAIVPATMTLIGGPIDTLKSATAVNKLAEDKGLEWFKSTVITEVPFPYKGAGREVYPGFLQLAGFLQMNPENHTNAHKKMFNNIVVDKADDNAKSAEFYDEYMAVMDLTAEFYLQTIDKVFVNHLLSKGLMTYRDRLIDCSAIKRVALLTIEGENDDITGLGQTQATHDLCTSIPAKRKQHFVQADVGHYGLFSGSRFRNEIAPKVGEFIKAMG